MFEFMLNIMLFVNFFQENKLWSIEWINIRNLWIKRFFKLFSRIHYGEIYFNFWLVKPEKKKKKKTATGDQNAGPGDRMAELWRHRKRHGAGFAGLGGHSVYQEAPQARVAGLIVAHSAPPPSTNTYKNVFKGFLI